MGWLCEFVTYKVLFGTRKDKECEEQQFEGTMAVRSRLVKKTGLGVSGSALSLWWRP